LGDIDIRPGPCYIIIMEEERKGKGSTIWFWLIPVFIIAAWPAYRWMKKANSGDIDLSKDEYSVFNSQEGEVRKTEKPAEGDPGLDEGIMGVRYKSKAAAAREEKIAEEQRTQERETEEKRGAAAATAGNQNRNGKIDYGQSGVDALKAREQQSVGFTQGLMGNAVSRVMNNPKALNAIFSNKYVVSGFMSRGAVKAATASPQGLANYLKSDGPANFLNNSLVKAALNNPAIISAVASSGLVSALLDTPAAKALMNDPKALGDLMTSNPQLVSLAMSNPNTLNMLLSNPDVSGVVNKFDTSEVQKKYGH